MFHICRELRLLMPCRRVEHEWRGLSTHLCTYVHPHMSGNHCLGTGFVPVKKLRAIFSQPTAVTLCVGSLLLIDGKWMLMSSLFS